MTATFRYIILFSILVTIINAIRNFLFLNVFTINDPLSKSLVSTADNFQNCKIIQDDFKDSNLLNYISWNNSLFNQNTISYAQCLINRGIEGDEFSLKDKASTICLGLETLEQAIELDPHFSDYKLVATRMSYLFKNHLAECELKGSKYINSSIDDYQIIPTLESIKNLTPNDFRINYLTALVALNVNHKSEALLSLKQVEAQDPFFTEEQRNFFYSLISNEKDLEIAIANNYPNINYWIEYFYSKRQKQFYLWENIFTKAFNTALNQFNQDFLSGKIQIKVFEREIEALVYNDTLREHEGIRKQIDLVAASFCKKEQIKSCLSLFQTRSQLTSLKTNKSFILSDKNPGQNNFENWQLNDSEEEVRLNIRDRSLGIELTENIPPKLIILENDHIRKSTDSSAVVVWGSNDNERYQQLGTTDYERVIFGEHELIVVTFKNKEYFRFLKIQYRSADQSGTFRNKFSKLIQAYGEAEEGVLGSGSDGVLGSGSDGVL